MKKPKGASIAYSLIKDGDITRLSLLMPLTLEYGNKYDDLFEPKLLGGTTNLSVDFGSMEKYDSYLIIFYNNLKKKCHDDKIEFKPIGLTPEMSNFLGSLKMGDSIAPIEKSGENSVIKYISHIGEHTNIFFKELRNLTEFFGDLFVSLFKMFLHPSGIRWKDFPFHFMRAGVNGLLICLLILFIIGIISGYQGALQLRQFGADIFISDLIGISITRELSPLMVAILVAGRSGSAFAAEIGTMKVSDEIDALRSMGFDYYQFLVLPRVLAVTVAMPILTILSDIAGIAGGLLASLNTLDITTAAYMNELQRALGYDDIFTGILKSIVFGFLVASVGCFQGMQVRGGAESVGKYTTASVVSGIMMIILSDAVFTFLFNAIGI